MTTQTETATAPEPDQTVEKKIQQLRELYADAPEVGQDGAGERAPRCSTSSVGGRRDADGKRRPGRQPSGQGLGADHDRSVRATAEPSDCARCCSCWTATSSGADKVGTVHDMRFVFLDNDTKLLFATAYDGDWDPYIDDFATKIPDDLDICCSAIARVGRGFAARR